MTEWDRVVSEFGPAVYATAWRVLGTAAEAELVVHEVFSQARRSRQGWEGQRCGPYLRRLAVCLALDRLRRRRFLAEPERGQAGRLRASLGRLSRVEAAAFALRYLDDLPCEQVAETLLLSCAAVAAALGRARDRLESLLSQAAPEPAGL